VPSSGTGLRASPARLAAARREGRLVPGLAGEDRQGNAARRGRLELEGLLLTAILLSCEVKPHPGGQVTYVQTTALGSLDIIMPFTSATPRYNALLTRVTLMLLYLKALTSACPEKLKPSESIPQGLQNWQMFAATQKSLFHSKIMWFFLLLSWNKLLRTLKTKVSLRESCLLPGQSVPDL